MFILLRLAAIPDTTEMFILAMVSAQNVMLYNSVALSKDVKLIAYNVWKSTGT